MKAGLFLPRAHPASRTTGAGLVLVLCLAAGCGSPSAERAGGPVGRAVEAALAGGTAPFEHREWDALLGAAVRDGLMDYRVVRERRPEFEAYLRRLAAARLEILAPDHLKALLINAYNACTVAAILDHPRARSIRQIPGVWTSDTHRVGGFEMTLDDIEHRLLRPFFKDPRIHFVLNCASLSCAPLVPWAYDGDRLERQLEVRTRAFLTDPRQVRIEGDSLALSRYFDWYGKDFTTDGWHGAASSVVAYVARGATPEVARFIGSHAGQPPTVFLEYDWSLNRAPTGDPPPPPTGPKPPR